MTREKTALNQGQTPEADMALAADDDVVVDQNPQLIASGDDFLGHIDIGKRRRWIT